MNSKLVYLAGAISGTIAVAWGIKSPLKDTKLVSECECKSSREDLGLEKAIIKARELTLRLKDEVGAPGIVIGVSVDGKTVWRQGFGYADVENRTPCHPDTVMRIASISKSLTMAMVAKLWEEGKLDLDKPIQEYVSKFPKKTFEGKEVTLTTRMLVSHLGGIRHYTKKGEKQEKEHEAPKDKKKDKVLSTREKEVFSKDKYETIEAALAMFKDDELMSSPGTQYLYSTHGWTLVSAVVEGAGSSPFTTQAKKLFLQLGLHNTRLDENDPIIYNRARYYRLNSYKRLTNVPYTDNSYKWAGGGFLSDVGDLLKFGNCMLYSYQCIPSQTLLPKNNNTVENFKNFFSSSFPEESLVGAAPGFLKPETMKMLWTRVPLTESYAGGMRYRGDGYGMGWHVVPYRAEHGTSGGGDVQPFHASHTGAAVGASSVLLCLPAASGDESLDPPQGVCVAAITNLESVGLDNLAYKVALLFSDHSKSEEVIMSSPLQTTSEYTSAYLPQ